MKEQLYTIPVNDAFNEPCECPNEYRKKKLTHGISHPV